MTGTQKPLIVAKNDEANCVIQGIKTDGDAKETMALLKILVMGSKQIEVGKFKPAREVLARLDKAILNKRCPVPD